MNLLYLEKYFWIGQGFTLCAVVTITCGFSVKKKALLRIQDDPKSLEIENYHLRDATWWLGTILVCLGEVFYVGAYGLAPVCVVTPLTALVLTLKPLLTKFLLYESLNVISQVSFCVNILGCYLIVLNGPKLLHVPLEILVLNLTLPSVITIVAVLFLIAIAIAIYLKQVIYSKLIWVYVIMWSAVRTLQVMSYKYLGLFIKESFTDSYILYDYKPYLFLVSALACYAVEQRYFKKASDIFMHNIVESLNYVVSTIVVLFVSEIVFEEWNHLGYQQLEEIWLGFVLNSTGLFFLYSFSVYSIEWTNLKYLVRMKENVTLTE